MQTIAHVLAVKGGKVVVVRPEQTVRDALRILAAHNIGAVVVVDAGNRPLGILSERDVVRMAVRDERVFDRRVEELMSRDLTLGAPADDLRAVGQTMTEKRIRHLPIVEGGRLVGIVSLGDVVKAERDRYQGEVDTLQMTLLKSPAPPAGSTRSPATARKTTGAGRRPRARPGRARKGRGRR